MIVEFKNSGRGNLFIVWKDNRHREILMPSKNYVRPIANVEPGQTHREFTGMQHVFRLTSDVTEAALDRQITVSLLERDWDQKWWDGFVMGEVAAIAAALCVVSHRVAENFPKQRQSMV